MSVRTVVARLQNENKRLFEEGSLLRDAVDALREHRKQALLLAQQLPFDVPQRHRLIQILEREVDAP